MGTDVPRACLCGGGLRVKRNNEQNNNDGCLDSTVVGSIT